LDENKDLSKILGSTLLRTCGGQERSQLPRRKGGGGAVGYKVNLPSLSLVITPTRGFTESEGQANGSSKKTSIKPNKLETPPLDHRIPAVMGVRRLQGENSLSLVKTP
jgi:hypothetical protein